MTISDRYAPGQDTLSGPAYPTAFGITFTPQISGILVGAAGVLAAGWLAMTFVGPKFSEMSDLRTQIAQKEQDLQNKQSTVQAVEQIVKRVNEAKAKNVEVRGLFSNQQALDTLLLDLNRIIGASGAQLQKFNPDYGLSGTVTDSTLGPELNNQLKRQVTDVAFEGTFAQTLEIMRAVDRLQTVLILRDFKMELQENNTSKPGQPKNAVTSSFKLYAYVPLTPEEQAAVQKQTAAAGDQSKSSDGKPPAQ